MEDVNVFFSKTIHTADNIYHIIHTLLMIARIPHLIALDITLLLRFFGAQIRFPQIRFVVDAFREHQIAHPTDAVNIRPVHLLQRTQNLNPRRPVVPDANTSMDSACNWLGCWQAECYILL